jgi:mannitol/fructose-specific phosphotransferase system IIA component (Ntr-type)
MGKLFLYLGLGEVAGQLLGGLLISPYVFVQLGIFSSQYTNAFLSFRFLIFIFLGLVAFGIGEELNSTRIKEVGKSSFFICIIQALATFILVTLAFIIMGFRPISSFIIGSIGVATAPAALFILMNKMTIEGPLRSKLANIVVIDDVIEIIFFSIFVQMALFLERGEKIALGIISQRVFLESIFALGVGLTIFIFLKVIVREVKFETMPAPTSEQTGLGFLRFIFHDTPTPSVEIFLVLMGLIVIGSAVAWIFHLPFLLTITFAGFLVANFHSRRLFDSLFIGNITPIINLIFFGLIGSSVDLASFNITIIKYVIVYILMRSLGKIVGTWIGCKMTGEDIKISKTLPLLMLPQAGVSAVEVAFVALILPKEARILQIIVPAILFFEIAGIILSELTLKNWKSWVVGETEALRGKLFKQPREYLLSKILKEDNIKMNLKGEDKKETISELLEVLANTGEIKGRLLPYLFKEFVKREKIQSTGIGDNIAVPHIRSDRVEKIICALGIKPKGGIDFSSIDGKRVNIVFLFISPEEDNAAHLKLLSEITYICRKKENRELILTLPTAKDIVYFLKKVMS